MRLSLYKVAIGTKESEWYSIYTVAKNVTAANLLVTNLLEAVGTKKKLIIRGNEKLNDTISTGEASDVVAVDYEAIFKEYKDSLESLEDSK